MDIMNHLGTLIDCNGKVTYFGIWKDSNSGEYNAQDRTMRHPFSFEDEILNTPYFKSLGIPYNKEKQPWGNGENFARNGLILIYNDSDTIEYTDIALFVPSELSNAQKEIMLRVKKQLEGIRNFHICVVQTNDSDDKDYYFKLEPYYDKYVAPKLMQHLGLLIDRGGNTSYFGRWIDNHHLDKDDDELLHSPSFLKEIVNTPYWQNIGANYDVYKDIDENRNLLISQGFVLITNWSGAIDDTILKINSPAILSLEQKNVIKDLKGQLDFFSLTRVDIIDPDSNMIGTLDSLEVFYNVMGIDSGYIR